MAAFLLNRVLTQKTPLDPLLDGAHGERYYRKLSNRDQALVRAILGTALRHHGEIIAALNQRLDKPLHDNTQFLSAILQTGAAQILYLDLPDHAAVNLAVALAKGDRRTRRASGLVNSLLRRIIADREKVLSRPDADLLNFPEWMMGRWKAYFGEEIALDIARAHGTPPHLDLTAKEDPDTVARLVGGTVLANGSVRLEKPGSIKNLPGYEQGLWWVQDSAAAMSARFLPDIKGKRVADLCAAPGGKSAQLAAAGADVVAVDRSELRLKRLEENLQRLGLSAALVAADIINWEPGERFDAILLDAPCTATGTIRRHPDIPWIRNQADIAQMADLQTRMLNRSADWLNPGGYLIYSTCSLEPEEGELQSEAFLSAHADFSREKIRVNEVAGQRELLTSDGDFRSKPSDRWGPQDIQGGMDGFFAARFRYLND